MRSGSNSSRRNRSANLLRFVHRWSGGAIGLLLAIMGLSGALLAHKDLWINLPHVSDPQMQQSSTLASAVETILAGRNPPPKIIFFATKEFGLNRLVMTDGSGAYTDQTGRVVAQWASKWERPEIWLFDLHHYLLSGETGETVAGILALFGLLFVLTGLFLWWPLRKSFRPRVLPPRPSRPAIVRHHRDLGAIMAPLLLISFATGAMMVFRPLTAIALGPDAPQEIEEALQLPAPRQGMLAPDFDWKRVLDMTQSRFPGGEIRLIAFPSPGNGMVKIQVRQNEEWLPNGRTMLWFSADAGELVDVRDERAMPRSVRAYNKIYPIHSGKTGSLLWRLAVTVSGLSLGLLGMLAAWAFWRELITRRS